MKSEHEKSYSVFELTASKAGGWTVTADMLPSSGVFGECVRSVKNVLCVLWRGKISSLMMSLESFLWCSCKMKKYVRVISSNNVLFKFFVARMERGVARCDLVQSSVGDFQWVPSSGKSGSVGPIFHFD